MPGYNEVMTKPILAVAILFLLFAVNLLTFHDLLEPHTVRDWLTLLASVLVLGYFMKDLRGLIRH